MKQQYKVLGLWLLGGFGAILLAVLLITALSFTYAVSSWINDDGVEKTMIEEMRIETEGTTIYIKGLHVEVSSRLIIPMLISAISD